MLMADVEISLKKVSESSGFRIIKTAMGRLHERAKITFLYYVYFFFILDGVSTYVMLYYFV